MAPIGDPASWDRRPVPAPAAKAAIYFTRRQGYAAISPVVEQTLPSAYGYRIH
jgi:hypothetical protein